jgi:uroporphyrinogen-III synthase
MELVRALRESARSKVAVDPVGSSRDFEALHEMAIRIFSPVPLHDVLAGVVEFVSAAVKCDSCFIYVLEDDVLLLRASKNPHPEIVNRLKLRLGQGITGWVASHKKPVCIGQNAYGDPRFKLFNQLPEDHFESFLSVPIVSHGRVVGVINLQNRAIHHFDHGEVQIVSTIGLLVGAAVEIALLETKTLRLSDQLETRKLVERAKGILQRDLGISEEEAYAALQRESCRRRKPMRDLAEALLFNEEFKRGLKS